MSVPCTVALTLAMTGCAQKTQTSTPPPIAAGSNGTMALVYEDDFSGDAANANGELKNVKGSSSNPLRPDWQYRTSSGPSHGCVLGTSANVFLSQTAGGVPGLILSDTASNPQSTSANFPSGPNQAYQSYTCGGLVSTRRFGFGYYETYGSLNVSTATPGFHTSFWTYNLNSGGYHADEADVFENESIDNYTGKGFNTGIFQWNDSAGSQLPAHHPYEPWSSTNGGVSTPHTWGMTISPTMYEFYVDGSIFSQATASTPGPYVASEIEFSSVGSVDSDALYSTVSGASGPWIQYDGQNNSKTYNYAFQYFKYYQETNPQLLRSQALSPGSIFIDPTVQGYSGTGSSFLPGNFLPYLSYPYAGAINHNMVYGPQGYRGQNIYTSTVAGDTATLSHVFSAMDAGSYDVFVWNASAGSYQLPITTGNYYAPDSASNTQYVLGGSVGPAPATQTISQALSGQQWVALNSAQASTLFSTNTYAFTPGSTANIVITVGMETATASNGTAFTPHTNVDSVAFVPVYTFGTSNAAYYSDNGFASSALAGWSGAPASRFSSAPSGQAQWKVPLPSPGTYTVYVSSPADGNTTNYAYYTMSDGSVQLGSSPVNQSLYGNQWVPLGTYTWGGSTATVAVQNGNGTVNPANGYLRTNAIKFVQQVPNDYIVCTSSTGIYGVNLYSISGAWTIGNHGYAGCGSVDQVSNANGASATFSPQVPIAGMYHAYIYADPSLSETASITVQSHSSQLASCNTLTTTGNGQWIYLGDYFFGPDSYPSEGNGKLINDSISITSTGGSVGVSAVKLSYSSSIGNAGNICTNN